MIVTLVALVGHAVALCQPPEAVDRVVLKEDYQVLQRDANDRASCAVLLPKSTDRAAKIVVTVEVGIGHVLRRIDSSPISVGAKGLGIVVEGLQTGGPYTITVMAKDHLARPLVQFRRVLVGDIWVLGGQSNMFGIDVIMEPLPELPYLNMLNVLHVERDAHWCAGVPPIHRIPESLAPFVIKGQHPEYSEEKVRSIIASKIPVGGIDCSYFFARKLYALSGVPIGLIPCATGGALAIWDPRGRDGNRYGFLQHHVMSAGGRVKGVLFFQGEQDAIFGDKDRTVTTPSLIGPVSTYGAQFTKFVEALRTDFRDPTMPVIFAQICRHHNGPTDRAWAWEAIREAQRRLPETLLHTHCVPSIDLDVMDGLHLDYNSLTRMGERMARVALPYTKKGVPERGEIRLKAVTRVGSPKPRIVVEFTGVNGKLQCPGSTDWVHVQEGHRGDVGLDLQSGARSREAGGSCFVDDGDPRPGRGSLLRRGASALREYRGRRRHARSGVRTNRS